MGVHKGLKVFIRRFVHAFVHKGESLAAPQWFKWKRTRDVLTYVQASGRLQLARTVAVVARGIVVL